MKNNGVAVHRHGARIYVDEHTHAPRNQFPNRMENLRKVTACRSAVMPLRLTTIYRVCVGSVKR